MQYEEWAKENMIEELIRVLLRSAYNAGFADAEKQHKPPVDTYSATHDTNFDLERKMSEPQ